MRNVNKSFLGFILFMITVYGWLIIDQESCLQIFAPVTNRELGVIELLQSVVLVVILFIGISQIRLNFKLNGLPTICWSFFSAIITFVFLEEIDYGLHYYDFLRGNNSYTTSFGNGFRNIHNQGTNNQAIKAIIIVVQTLFFGILPFLNSSVGKVSFRKIYALFYWTIAFSTPILSLIITNTFSLEEASELTKSQLFAEMRELAFYLMLLVFIVEFRNVLFTSWNFVLTKNK